MIGQEDCKLQVSYVQVIYVLKRQNKAFLKYVQQTARKMICFFIKLDTLNDLLLSQPVLFANKRNEKDWACMIHPPYSVAHAYLQINSMCL